MSALTATAPIQFPRCPIHVVENGGMIDIPDTVVDHESFRLWARSDAFPEKIRCSFYRGELWLDVSMEQLYTHGQVKSEALAVLRPLARRERRGRFYPDGTFLTNTRVGLSTIPDGLFVSFDSLEAGRVEEVDGQHEGVVELSGSPDMVMEILSRGSEEKDTIDLPKLYWQAGIDEYWLIDVRTTPLQFAILRRGTRGFVPVKRQAGGWVKSTVFGHSFRLLLTPDPHGRPDYTLEVR